MAKRLLSLWILICAVIVIIPSALAEEFQNNEGMSPSMQITDTDYANGGCAFQLHLSADNMNGTVFVAVFDAQSGQMKRIEEYQAKETLPVALDSVPDTDIVKVMWLDGQYMPLAQSGLSRSSSVESLTYAKYDDFAVAAAQMINDYSKYNGDVIGQSGEINPYAYARLIVRSQNPLPDLSGQKVDKQLSDGQGHTILQFTSPEDAKNCETYLRQYIPSDTVDNYVTPDAPTQLPPEPTNADAFYDDIDASSYSWGVSAIHADLYAADLAKRGMSSDIIVAVIDTGVDYNHTFLKGRTVSGYDYVGNDNNPMDEHYHGTHVAGTIVDCTPGLSRIKIMPVRVLDAGGGGTYLNVSLGIRYAADHGANIINMSLGGNSGACSAIDEAVDYAVSKNVVVVVAAGNESDNAKNHCPAHNTKCITVAAVDSKLVPAYFTNYGDVVDLAAPGVEIKSSTPNNSYKTLDGTSMASPHVAACAAMLRADNPSSTPAQIEKKLVDAVQVPSGWKTTYGAGVVDLEKLTNPEPSEFYAILYSNGEMVFQNSSKPDSSRTTLHTPYPISAVGAQYAGWYTLREKITKVTFAEEVHPASTALWFYDCKNLTTIQKLENLKTDGVKNMSQMFARCSALETLDLRGFNTKNVTNTRQMFFKCDSLRTILASDSFSVANVTDGTDMFTGCTSLTGESGTTYSSSYTGKTYARIDGGSSKPGYFSSKIYDGPTNPIYAVLYSSGELKFQSSPNAESGRTALKSYTTDSGGYDGDVYTAWYEERAKITSVNFSVPIYPESTALWFYGCEKLASISNVSNLHTDYVTDMSQMFAYCSSLTSLDLSKFNTGRTVNTAEMFYKCSKLKTIYASSLFTTSKITDSESMFEGCTVLKGGNGTSYSSNYIDKTYARLDSSYAKGYFTSK